MPSVVKQSNRVRTSKPAQDGWPDQSDGIKINVYGRSGTGKTTLWATFPGPILCLICSGGKRPGELRSIDTAEYRKKITPRVLRESTQVRENIEDVGEFQTVVLDHASGLQDMVLKEILGIEELPAQGSWGMAKQQDWGTAAMQVKEILRALLSLRCNVVVIAQEREFNTDTESELVMPYVASAMTPSVVGWLNPACDYICQTYIRPKMVQQKVSVAGKEQVTLKRGKGVEYCLRTAPHDVFTTKFRVPRGVELPESIVDPTYDKIMELIRGGE